MTEEVDAPFGGLDIRSVPLDLAPSLLALPRTAFPLRDLRAREEQAPGFDGAAVFRDDSDFLAQQYAEPVALKPDPLLAAGEVTLFGGSLWVNGRLVPGSVHRSQATKAFELQEAVAALRGVGRLQRLAGTTALIHSAGYRTYFHWTAEVLPRFAALRQYLRSGHGTLDRILVPMESPPSFVEDSLRHLFPDLLPLVQVTPKARHDLEHALFFLDWRYMGSPLTRVKDTTIAFLDQLAERARALPQKPQRALLISRADADNRRMVNEEALIEAMAPLGLESVCLTGLPVAEQAALMGQARLIVGVHGAGLTNMIFCRPGTAVLEITSTQYIRRARSYADLALARGFPYALAVVDQHGPNWIVTGNRGNDLEASPEAIAGLRAMAEDLLAGHAFQTPKAPPERSRMTAPTQPASPPPLPSPQDPAGAEMGKDPIQPTEIAQQLLNRLNELIRLQQLVLLGPERVLEFAFMDNWVRMHLPLAGQDVIQRRIVAQRTFFETDQLADIRPAIPPGAVVIDAGANIGNHSLFFAMVCRAWQVHAFEPMRVAFATLKRNIELNGLQDVIVAHHAAVGAREGTADLLRYVEHNTGGTVLGLDKPGFYPVVPIDSLRLERCDFLKMDVEGGQIQALEGAAATIARCRPLIWVELRSKRSEFEDGNAKMQSMGYKLLRQVANSTDDFLFGPA